MYCLIWRIKDEEKYNQAVLLGEQGDYQEANQILEELLNQRQLESAYLQAIELLKQLPADYEDVPDKLALCKEYKDISVE